MDDILTWDSGFVQRGNGDGKLVTGRNGGVAQKNMERLQNFDGASRRRHLERSREISLADR